MRSKSWIGVIAGAGLLAVSIAVPPASAAPAPLQGTIDTVAASGLPDDGAGWAVDAFVSGNPMPVATATSGPSGQFSLALGEVIPADGVLTIHAHAPDDPTAALATVLTDVPSTLHVTVNERTTVAAAWAMAQFVSNTGVDGAAPGLRNSAGMAANLADPATGAIAPTLADRPNGSYTSTLRAFHTLTAALAACTTAPSAATCGVILGLAAQAADPLDPADTLRALAEIARNPAVAPTAGLWELAGEVSLADGAPTLSVPPVAWTLALRFDGDGKSLSGPGNFAIDHEGNLWVNNNYEYGSNVPYGSDPRVPVCGSDELFKFSPTGVGFTAYSGGGLSGSGFGVALDPVTGNVWASNFGFAAPKPGCPQKDQPPHNSLSVLSPDGLPLSGDKGLTRGRLSWPQGMDIDATGTVWTANCKSDTVTFYPGGDPRRAGTVSKHELGLDMPFDVVDNGRSLFVSGMLNDGVQMLGYDGSRREGSPGSDSTLFANPMGLATDATGNVWVANSDKVVLPCPFVPGSKSRSIDIGDVIDAQFDDTGVYLGAVDDASYPYLGSVAMISPDGSDAVRYEGGGTTLPWGIATDGDGNVWVANFAGKRLSHFCGAQPSTCPPGATTGASISPDITGYYFDGLVRNTGVAVDQSGTVWLANNWLEIPYQTNPGGHEIVAFLGLAAPVSIAAPTGG